MKIVLLMWLLAAPKYSAESWLSVLAPHRETRLIIPKSHYLAAPIPPWDGTAQ